MLLWRTTLAAQRDTLAAQAAITAKQGEQSRLLAAQSASMLAAKPKLAAFLAVAAYRISPTTEADAALRSGAHLPTHRRLDLGIDYVSAVAFSPDGLTLASSSMDGSVRLWSNIAPDAAISAICTAVGGDITPEDKKTYLPESSGPVCPS